MRLDVVEAARGWVGTPYQDQASVRGVGSDCLGLIRGVWRDVDGVTLFPAPIYTSDWAEVSDQETLLCGLAIYLKPRIGTPESGDILAFRMREDAIAKHLAFYIRASGEARIIHAYTGRGVVETRLSPFWERRIAGVYQFPDRRK